MRKNNVFTLALLADTHYYSPMLGTDGEAYRLRSGSDQKCLAESGDILRSAFRQIRASGADAVVIAGDLTNNGELCSHEELRNLLREMREVIPVYVLTATHDWCSDRKCARYVDRETIYDVPTMAAESLAAYYGEFGPDASADTFTTPDGAVSCMVPLQEDLRLLLLNDDRNGKGRAGYTEAHLRWIEAQLHKAAADNARVIAAAHHPVLPPIHPFLTTESSIGDWEKIAARLADAGLRCIVTGHLHMQDLPRFCSQAGNPLTEIALGALCGWPGNIVYADVLPDRLLLRTESMAAHRDLLRAQSFGVLTDILDAAKESRAEYRKRTDALYLRHADLVYPLVRKWAARFDTWTTAESYAAVRKRIRLLPKLDLKDIGDDPLHDTVERVFLSLFGDGLSLCETDELYRLVMAFFALPSRLLPFPRRARELRESGKALLQKGTLQDETILLTEQRHET